jgi:hypothetical protein
MNLKMVEVLQNLNISSDNNLNLKDSIISITAAAPMMPSKKLTKMNFSNCS